MNLPNPALIRELHEQRRCEWCGVTLTFQPEVDHIFGRGTGGGQAIETTWSLAVLGGPWDCACHHRRHLGLIPKGELLAKVAEREGTTADAISEAVFFLRRLDRDACALEVRHRITELPRAVRRLVRPLFRGCHA